MLSELVVSVGDNDGTVAETAIFLPPAPLPPSSLSDTSDLYRNTIGSGRNCYDGISRSSSMIEVAEPAASSSYGIRPEDAAVSLLQSNAKHRVLCSTSSSPVCHTTPSSASNEYLLVSCLPPLVHRAIYWHLCCTVALLCFARPDILGRHLWSNYPEVRQLLKMMLCSSFQFHDTTSATGS